MTVPLRYGVSAPTGPVTNAPSWQERLRATHAQAASSLATQQAALQRGLAQSVPGWQEQLRAAQAQALQAAAATQAQARQAAAAMQAQARQAAAATQAQALQAAATARNQALLTAAAAKNQALQAGALARSQALQAAAATQAQALRQAAAMGQQLAGPHLANAQALGAHLAAWAPPSLASGATIPVSPTHAPVPIAGPSIVPTVGHGYRRSPRRSRRWYASPRGYWPSHHVQYTGYWY